MRVSGAIPKPAVLSEKLVLLSKRIQDTRKSARHHGTGRRVYGSDGGAEGGGGGDREYGHLFVRTSEPLWQGLAFLRVPEYSKALFQLFIEASL